MKRYFNIGDEVYIVGQDGVDSFGLIIDIKRILWLKMYAVRYFYTSPYTHESSERHDWFTSGRLARRELKAYGKR